MADVEARQVAEGKWTVVAPDVDEAARLAQWLRQAPGVAASWSAFERVAVEADLDLSGLLAGYSPGLVPTGNTRHEVPVCYELGEDLDAVCAELGISRDRFVALHTGQDYVCGAVGFSPGFGYLTGLPAEISGVARLPSPRRSVEPGSVGITEAYTAVYSEATPGGWRIVGRTPLVMASAGFYPLAAGDRVRFVRVNRDEYERRKGGRLGG